MTCLITNNLFAVKWSQVLSNTNSFQTYPFDSFIGNENLLPLRVSLDL